MATKRWGVVDTGPEASREEVEGWLLEEEKDQIRLADDRGDYYRFRRPRPGERRPAGPEPKHIPVLDEPFSRFPVAWRIRPGDFLARCRQTIENFRNGVSAYRTKSHELEWLPVTALRQAHWADQLGEQELAAQLREASRHKSDKAALAAPAIAKRLACRYRQAAVLGATESPRTESLRAWELVARIPFHDSRPTRSVALANRFSSDPWHVLRYGDCCPQIFQEITGHTIYRYQYPMRDDKGKQCKAEAERWWAEYQRKGEKRMLIEGVEAGSIDSLKLAERLLKTHPDAALEPMLKGRRDFWWSAQGSTGATSFAALGSLTPHTRSPLMAGYCKFRRAMP